MRALLKETFFAHPHVDVVGLAKSVQEAIDFTKSRCPHVVVVDSRLTVPDGQELVSQLKEVEENLFVVAFTADTNLGRARADEMLLAGADAMAYKPKAMGTPDAALNFLSQSLMPILLKRISS